MKLAKVLLFLLVILSLQACSSLFGKNENEYLQSKEIPKIRIPSSLASAKIETYYPIPAKRGNGSPKSGSLIPPGTDLKNK